MLRNPSANPQQLCFRRQCAASCTAATDTAAKVPQGRSFAVTRSASPPWPSGSWAALQLKRWRCRRPRRHLRVRMLLHICRCRREYGCFCCRCRRCHRRCVSAAVAAYCKRRRIACHSWLHNAQTAYRCETAVAPAAYPCMQQVDMRMSNDKGNKRAAHPVDGKKSTAQGSYASENTRTPGRRAASCHSHPWPQGSAESR